ncbi:hypothetical protein KDL01_31045, partial [Actinospica durhamensis]
MGGQGPRDAALALKDTFGKAADDISGKAADFHDVTAEASLRGAHAMGETDSQYGNEFGGVGKNPDSVPDPK